MMIAIARVAWGTHTDHPFLETFFLWLGVVIYLARLEANPIHN